jgi:hypothetical protein
MSADRTDDVVAAIDHLLAGGAPTEDWAVSPDAMRWMPEPAGPPDERSQPGRAGLTGPLCNYQVDRAGRVREFIAPRVPLCSDPPEFFLDMRVVPDSDLRPGEAIVTAETEFEDVTFEAALHGRYIVAQRPELHIPIGLTDEEHEALLRDLAAHYNVSLCYAVREHQWTPWTYDRDRDWWAKECQRQGCDHTSAVSGRLVRSGEYVLVGDMRETDDRNDRPGVGWR